MKRSCTYRSLMEIIPEAFSLLYPRHSDQFFGFTRPNNALYPWGTSVGKDKHGLSIGLSTGSANFKHERNAIMPHQPVFKLHPVQLPVEPLLGQRWSRSWVKVSSITWIKYEPEQEHCKSSLPLPGGSIPPTYSIYHQNYEVVQDKSLLWFP